MYKICEEKKRNLSMVCASSYLFLERSSQFAKFRSLLPGGSQEGILPALPFATSDPKLLSEPPPHLCKHWLMFKTICLWVLLNPMKNK